MSNDLKILNAELARREMARRWYSDYLPYVHGKNWKQTRMAQYLASEVQAFLEEDTGNAYDILVIQTPPQHGKECADDTLVPTPTGWKRHGDLHVGDMVFGMDGKPRRVLAEIPQEEPASMKVTFSDGAEIVVHPNHEWVVRDWGSRDCRPEARAKGEKLCTHETKWMLEQGLWTNWKSCNRRRFSVPPAPRVEYEESELAAEPSLVGLWLGSKQEGEPPEFLHGVLEGYGRRIPPEYMISSVEQRRRLLTGIINANGGIERHFMMLKYREADDGLREDVVELARSLGWRSWTKGDLVKMIPTDEHRRLFLQRRQHKLNHNVRFRAIVNIEPCEPKPGKCITVEGGVYLVGKHFTPTHNSMTLTETLPSWVLGKYPDWRIILGSYNDESADRFARRNKEKVREHCNTLFNIQIGRVDRATEFELDGKLGRLISRGIMSGVTGNPANLMIIDDPIKNRQEADSPTYRRKLWEEWQNSFKTRLAAHGKVIVIATPWHEDDMMANLLKTEDNIRLIRLPVEAEENDPLGRGVGEALCPELGKDNKWLEQFKSSYQASAEGGQRAWSALYQCQPRVEGGNLVKREWWKYYDEKDLPHLATEVISVDAAFKDADSNDFVAITVWGKSGNDYYLRYCMNRHLDFTQTLDAIRQVQRLYPSARTVLIEDKANGSAVINVLQKELFCVPVNPKGGKVSRVNAVSAAIESGHVYVPANAPWLGDYLDQWTVFPAGAHDDMVDSSTQAMSYLIYSSGSYGADLPKQERLEAELMEREKDLFLDGSAYDVYGVNEPF